MKIATWNINSVNSRLETLLKWCAGAEPDVLCLQETKCVDAKFPQKQVLDVDFDEIALFGEKTNNGVAIPSKYPISDVQTQR